MDDDNRGGAEESLSKYKGEEGTYLRWAKEIDLVENSQERRSYERIGEQIEKLYRNHDALQVGSKSAIKSPNIWFNALWSNVEVLLPALFARMPKVVIERRFKDRDPIGRLAALSGERATSYMLQTQQDRAVYAIKGAVKDRLLPGCGQVWLRYYAEFEPQLDENGETVRGEDGEPIEVAKPNSEKVCIDPLHWKDYFWSSARNPFELRWQSRRVYMTRGELVKRFGEKGKLCELHDERKTSKKNQEEDAEFLKQAEVFEIQDLQAKERIWISRGYKKGPLDVKPDNLKLKDFWSCPIPLLATTTTGSMFPTPDFKIYERLADELEYVTKRMSRMVECIKFVGVTAAQYNDKLRNILKLDDGSFAYLEGWQAFMDKGGLKGIIDWFPFDRAVAALPSMMEYQQNVLSQINMITGIPDIAMGQTDPNETAEAQQRKSKWAVVKLQEKQQEVQRFCREIVSKVAEIIFEPGLFSDETLMLMCGYEQLSPEDQANFPAAIELLRNDRLRTFRVDIETDSTIAIDEQVEQQSRMEWFQSVTQMASQIEAIKQFSPELMSPMIESVLFTIRSFRTGRPVEGPWEQALQTWQDREKEQRENPQPPPPDPAMMKVEQEGQKIQQDGQLKMQELELDFQKAQMEFDLKNRELDMKIQTAMSKADVEQVEKDLDVWKEQFKQSMEAAYLKLEEAGQTLKLQEQFIEEARLKQDQTVEMMKALVTTNGQGEAKSPTIHIHNGGGSKEIAMKRGADGSLVGRVSEVPGDA